MTFLADVNVLMTLAWPQHTHFAKARAWWRALGKNDALATCAITELGFVRVSLQTPVVATDITGAKLALTQLRTGRPGHVFLPDALGADALPVWVKTAKHTTDGHLAALADEHGGKLATLDTGIPGSVLI